MINHLSAIDDIADAEQIRVLFYASNRMVHAPLNKVLDLIKNDTQRDLLSALTQYQEATEQRIETLQKNLDALRLQVSLSTHNLKK
ncbi:MULTISPECIES: hypothetical protein [Bartonella]|uniref:Uncharacterized protein n=2 Tax=Bartonella TaxID=773 RepID=A0A067WFY9_9HYPH|nr:MULTISPECIES: hypothetical protein [Bartonella]ATP12414.1 hypothetical protein BhenCHDE101_04490 [Bartonella henselae]ETS08599.1 hypothetical protein Q655_00869 [Bartonella henselae JK 51]ETS09146.1 hypothetical protein Q654_00916 [Bartonella henselae JK 50]KEC54832.1 hypothetical protein O9A_01023 [Bartonella koehlerae C-29]MDM9983748.1 hypothetical protein [Bartonella henselae]